MPVSYFVSVRQQMKVQLLEFINANNDKPMKQILALFSLKVGLKTSTLEQYLKELKDANLVVDEK